jgi:hypothetical protein
MVFGGCLLAAFTTLPALAGTRTIDTLKDLHATALEVADHADELDATTRTYGASEESYARQLEELKDDINGMGKPLHTLATSDLPSAAEKLTLMRAAALLNEVAANTQSAMVYLQEHRGQLWQPEYQKYIATLVARTGELAGVLGRAIQAAPRQ